MFQWLEHSTLGFCILDIAAAVIVASIAVFGIVRHRKLKEKKRELEDRVSADYLDNIMKND